MSPKLTPSVATSQPSFMASSTSLPIVAISAWVGGWLLGSWVKMLMNFMGLPPFAGFVQDVATPRRRTKGAGIDTGRAFFSLFPRDQLGRALGRRRSSPPAALL